MSNTFEVSRFLEYYSINHIANSLSRFQTWYFVFNFENDRLNVATVNGNVSDNMWTVQTSLNVDDRAYYSQRAFKQFRRWVISLRASNESLSDMTRRQLSGVQPSMPGAPQIAGGPSDCRGPSVC